MASSIPTVKIEGDDNVKMEDVSSPSAASEQFMDDADDDPELNFEDANKPLWMSKLPKYLWDALVRIGDNEEIELGTIRVEGSFDNPERVSLMLNSSPIFKEMEKEYVLHKQVGPARRSKRSGQVMMFSEKNRPGFKQRTNMWDNVDEDGNPGQGRSQLWEQSLREERKKENKGRYVPYQRRPIPKITALAGTVQQEFEAEPVDNAEHRRIDHDRTISILKEKRKDGTEIRDDMDAKLHYRSILSTAERQNITKAAQNKRAAAKEQRSAREDREVLLNKMFHLFREHKYWGLRDMRIRLNQPESWVKELLEQIADMHRAGDFNGKWELKSNLKVDDEALMNAVGEAPKMEDTDVDMKSEDDDEDFEDV